MLIEITEVSSVITWDFDVCKGDVIFNIYHSRRAPQPVKRDGLSTHNLACPAGNNIQLIDKAWMLGQDYSMVEMVLTWEGCLPRGRESVEVNLMKPTRNMNMAHILTTKQADQKMDKLLWFSSFDPHLFHQGSHVMRWPDSKSCSGAFTAAHHALHPVGRVLMMFWPLCRSPHTNAKSCISQKCCSPLTSGLYDYIAKWLAETC